MAVWQKKLIEAIGVRESGNLDESRKLFDKLISEVGVGDEPYPQVVTEYVIQLRLEAKELQRKALVLARGLENDYPGKVGSTRSVADVLSDLGEHEQTVERFRTLLHRYSHNSLRKGEIKAHLAKALLRSSKLDEAVQTIIGSVDYIRKNTAHEGYVAVRESYALRVAALIALAQGDKDKARRLAQEALVVAREGRAVFRIREAEELLAMLG